MTRGPAGAVLTMEPSITILIVSDDRLFADAVAALVAERADLRLLDGDAGADGRADVVLVDAAADRAPALARTAQARDRHAEAKLLVLGIEREDEDLVDFIEAGAQGYVLQSTSPADLVAAVHAIHRGQTTCSPRVAARVVARIIALQRRDKPQRELVLLPLTPREREILGHLSIGLRNKEIGHRLRITAQTVKNHVHSILDKLGVQHRRQAVRLAYELGLLAGPR
ncbi:MAG TPA: response regulator transcription factor [Thermoanaerobaculia bacterium]|nr:response regulator transcription factor [Thermoanaerobaculia bacterium]